MSSSHMTVRVKCPHSFGHTVCVFLHIYHISIHATFDLLYLTTIQCIFSIYSMPTYEWQSLKQEHSLQANSFHSLHAIFIWKFRSNENLIRKSFILNLTENAMSLEKQHRLLSAGYCILSLKDTKHKIPHALFSNKYSFKFFYWRGIKIGFCLSMAI